VSDELMMSERDLVSNRACGLSDRAERSTREGDVALSALLVAHGLVMNGGVLHAFDVLTPGERLAGAAGYRYFGFDELGALMERDIGVPDDLDAAERLEHELNALYWAHVKHDEDLVTRFHRHFASNPEAYAPVDASVT